MKSSTYPLVRKLVAIALLTGIALGNVSSSRGASTSTIKVTAIVLPKTTQINYRRLQDNINNSVKYFVLDRWPHKKGRSENQGKYLRVTVHLDSPEMGQGIMIEEVEYQTNF